MADATKIVTEQIPGVAGSTSGIASANAPVIFIDEVPVFGVYNGVVHMTCEALRFNRVDGASAPVLDRMVVAHLRMNKEAMDAMKRAIEAVEKMIADPSKNKLPPVQG